MPADRDQLIGFVDQYLAALAKNDPSTLPLAPNAWYTENCQTIALGQGSWAIATEFEPGSHFVDVAEPATGNVAYFGVIQEGGRPAILSLRLRVDDWLITEAEALVVRTSDTIGGLSLFRPENMVEPKPAFFETIPPESRCSRAEMTHICDLYFEAILSGNGDLVPVADDCVRVENGQQTVLNPERGTEVALMGVRAQINTGRFFDIEAARDRRYAIVDEERGLVFVIFFFDHPGPMTGSGRTSRYAAPNSMMVAELFKIRDREIKQIEAVLNVFPYGTKGGWD